MPEPWPTSEETRTLPSSVAANCTANLVPTDTSSRLPAVTSTPRLPATAPISRSPATAPISRSPATAPPPRLPVSVANSPVITSPGLSVPIAASPVTTSSPGLPATISPASTSPGLPVPVSANPASTSTLRLPVPVSLSTTSTSSRGLIVPVAVSPASTSLGLPVPVSVHVVSSALRLPSSPAGGVVTSCSSSNSLLPTTAVALPVCSSGPISATAGEVRLNGSGESPGGAVAADVAGGEHMEPPVPAANSMGFQITSVKQSSTDDNMDESGDEDATVDSSLPVEDTSAVDPVVLGRQTAALSPAADQVDTAGEDWRPVSLRTRSRVERASNGMCEESIDEQLPVIPTTDGFGITLVAGPRLSDLRCSAEMVVDFPADIEMDVTASGLTVASSSAVQEPVETWQSRFKVVKIETNVPFRRGRWQCMDYMDQPECPEPAVAATDTESVPGEVQEPVDAPSCHRDLPLVSAEEVSTTAAGSAQPSHVTSPVEESVTVPLPSDLSSAVSISIVSTPSISTSVTSTSMVITSAVNSSAVSSTAALQSGVDQAFSVSTATTTVSSDSGYSGTGTASSGAPVETGKAEPIDNKIEQAMDLVKSHLLLAVREEVDVLKTTIGRLMDRIGSLERENDILRGSVPADILQQLETTTPASAAPSPAASQPPPVVTSCSPLSPSSSAPSGPTL